MVTNWGKFYRAKQTVEWGSSTNFKIHKKKRRKKATLLEVELDLSGKFAVGDMPKSGLGGGEEAHTISAGNFKHRET